MKAYGEYRRVYLGMLLSLNKYTSSGMAIWKVSLPDLYTSTRSPFLMWGLYTTFRSSFVSWKNIRLVQKSLFGYAVESKRARFKIFDLSRLVDKALSRNGPARGGSLFAVDETIDAVPYALPIWYGLVNILCEVAWWLKVELPLGAEGNCVSLVASPATLASCWQQAWSSLATIIAVDICYLSYY